MSQKRNRKAKNARPRGIEGYYHNPRTGQVIMYRGEYESDHIVVSTKSIPDIGVFRIVVRDISGMMKCLERLVGAREPDSSESAITQ